MKRKYVNIAIVAVLAGLTGYIVYRRVNAGIVKRKLLEQLESHSGETGGIDDLAAKNEALNPDYFKNASKSSLLSDAQVFDYTTKLNKAIGNKYIPLTSDEKLALSIFSSLKNKAQVSQLSDAYLKKYSANLLDELKTMDYTVLGAPNLNPVMPKIKKLIDALPAK